VQSLKQVAGNDQNLYQRLVNAIERARSDRNIPPGGASGLATEGVPSSNTPATEEPLGVMQSRGRGGSRNPNQQPNQNQQTSIPPNPVRVVNADELSKKFASEIEIDAARGTQSANLQKKLNDIAAITDKAKKTEELIKFDNQLTKLRNLRDRNKVY
jgi:hypothetical protein